MEPCAEAQYVLISGAFVSHFICTESCAIIIQWFTLCSQNTHSYLLRGCRDAVRQLWVGGWVGDGERERERRLSSLPHNMKPESIPTSRALDPEYSRWWHFTMCRWWRFAEIGESVWSIDHCCGCPCLLCVSQCQLTLRERQWDIDTERGLASWGALIQLGWAEHN